jgi:hypothetical protein
MIELLLIIEDEKLLGSELSGHYRQSAGTVVLAGGILSHMSLLDGNTLDFMEKEAIQDGF